MKPLLFSALLALSAGSAIAQTGSSTGTYEVFSGPGIAHTGPRYCPELAGTEHPFAAVCPSWQASRELASVREVGTSFTTPGTAIQGKAVQREND